MKRLFDEYSILILCFVCSIIGFNMIYRILINGDSIHNIINHLLYGVI